MFMNDLYAAQLLTRSPQHLSNQRKRVSSVHNSSPAQNYKKNRAGMVPYSFIAGPGESRLSNQPSLFISGCNPLLINPQAARIQEIANIKAQMFIAHPPMPSPMKAIHKEKLILEQEPNQPQNSTDRSPNVDAQPRRRVAQPVVQPKPMDPNKYRYFLGGGNNFEMIGRILDRRPWWENVGKSSIMVNLHITQCTRQGEFEKYSSKDGTIGQCAKCINRFEGYKQLTDKDLMFVNLFNYCERMKIDAYQYVPLTFIIDFNDTDFEKKLQTFSRYFQSIEVFNRERRDGNIWMGQKGEWVIDKARWDAITGKSKASETKKAAKTKKVCKKKKEEKKEQPGAAEMNEDEDDESVEEPMQRSGVKARKEKPIKALSFVDHLASFKFDYDFSYLPKFRKEYPDPTTKGRTSKPVIKDTFNLGHNIWLAKPSGFCRGRGIEIFTELSQLNEFLPKFYQGYNDWENLEITEEKKKYYALTDENNAMKDIKLKSTNLVIQKYLESPMLIRGRKFDLRVFGLITPQLHAYVFEACYVRLSSETMDLSDKEALTNKYMHLTNNAIQELGPKYGLHEKGNIISIPEMQNILKAEGAPLDFENTIWPQIVEYVKLSTMSCAHLINPNDRKHCFEVYGYDFMIDTSNKVWLIEINSNPSFSESNNTVKTIIERMLDDAFKITIDKIFKPKAVRKEPIPPFNPPSMGRIIDNSKVSTMVAEDDKKKSSIVTSTVTPLNQSENQDLCINSSQTPTSYQATTDDVQISTSRASRHSQSAKPNFRISSQSKPSLKKQPTLRAKEQVIDITASKKNFKKSFTQLDNSTKAKKAPVEEKVEESPVAEGGRPPRVRYTTDSYYPLSYKDNKLNLWYFVASLYEEHQKYLAYKPKQI